MDKSNKSSHLTRSHSCVPNVCVVSISITQCWPKPPMQSTLIAVLLIRNLKIDTAHTHTTLTHGWMDFLVLLAVAWCCHTFCCCCPSVRYHVCYDWDSAKESESFEKESDGADIKFEILWKLTELVTLVRWLFPESRQDKPSCQTWR